MAEAAIIGTVASVGSLGLSAASSVAKGEGQQAGYEFQAKRAERAAEFGRTQAALTDTYYRDELNTTLANIDVIRAAGNIDPTSPTSIAVKERQVELSERQRRAAKATAEAQIEEDLASSRYLHEAGKYAADTGKVGAFAKILGGIGKAFS